MVRDLATPAWVDAVHHALITRLILINGSYPSTYLPLLNFSPTLYHPGFHSIAASFAWLTNLDLPHSLLILGQVLNAFAVFSVYLITKTLTRSAYAGLFAAFITGFITPLPAYYTSWSRYTELTGILLLPVVISLIQLWLDGDADGKESWILGLGALVAAGLFMIHYRVVVFLACLLIIYTIFRITFGSEPNQAKPGKIMLSCCHGIHEHHPCGPLVSSVSHHLAD
jgi:asparagine N-glycosylation enzyme membrane subunit Stt3